MAEGRNASLKGSSVRVTVVEGRSMPAAKAYTCLLKLRTDTHTSSVSSKTTTPKWNQDFQFELQDGDTEIQVKIFQKRFCIGEIVMPLLPFTKFQATKLDKWYKIKSTSHVEVSGEIHVVMHLHLKSRPTGRRADLLKMSQRSSQLALLELETAAMAKNVLDNVPNGPKTYLERMEQAILEEHDILSKELARTTKTDGSDSQKHQTIEEMLAKLKEQSERMQLAPTDPLELMPKPQASAVSKGDEASDASPVATTTPQSAGGSKGETPAPKRDISPTLARLIESLEGDQRSQREALLTLPSHLKEDEDSMDFVDGGGIEALLAIVADPPSESFQLKALEHLTTLSAEDGPRKAINMVPVMGALKELLTNPNEDVSVLACSCFTNACLAAAEDEEARAYICDGDGTEAFLSMVSSSNEYIQLRALWGMTNICLMNEQALVKRLIPLLCIVLKECKKKETLQMALLLLTNMSAFESNWEIMQSSEVIEIMFGLVTSAYAVVVVQVLKGFTNLAQHPSVRTFLTSPESSEKLVGKLRAETPYNNVKMHTAWLVSSIALDEESSKRLVEAGFVEALFLLLSDEGGRQQRADIRLKALWALTNISLFCNICERVASNESILESLTSIMLSQQSAVRSHVLKLLGSMLDKDDDAVLVAALKKSRAIDSVVALIDSGGRAAVAGAGRGMSSDSSKKDVVGEVLVQACWVASKLLQNPAVLKYMKSHGLVGGLVTQLGQSMSGSTDEERPVEQPVDAVLWLIYTLVKHQEMRDLFRGAGLLPPLYQTVSSASKPTRELSLAILSLMVSSEECKAEVIEHYLEKTKPQQPGSKPQQPGSKE